MRVGMEGDACGAVGEVRWCVSVGGVARRAM